MDPNDIRRRLKAARALTPPTEQEIADRPPRTATAETGLTVQELAHRLNEPGLGWKTLGAIERGERTAQRRDLIVLAEALDVPVDFFLISPLELYRRLAGGVVPSVPGATGRRLEAHLPSREDLEQPATDERGERSHGEP